MYNPSFAKFLAREQILFFDEGLKLKDGRPTPYFLNFGKCNTGKARTELGNEIASFILETEMHKNFDVLFGPAYKAISLADAVVDSLYNLYRINKRVDYNRKEAKTHGEGSKNSSILVNNSLYDGCRALIIDDVITSSKTKEDAIEIINAESKRKGITATISGIFIIVNREQKSLEGKNPIAELKSKTGIPVYCYSNIRNIIHDLYATKEPVLIRGNLQPIDDRIKKEFDEYMKNYGV